MHHMLGQRSSDLFSKPSGSLTKRIQSHYTSIFRELLLGGILFLRGSLDFTANLPAAQRILPLVSRFCRDPWHVIHIRHRECSDQRLPALQRYATWFCNRHDISSVWRSRFDRVVSSLTF